MQGWLRGILAAEAFASGKRPLGVNVVCQEIALIEINRLIIDQPLLEGKIFYERGGFAPRPLIRV